MSWHLATSREKAREEAADGLQNWHNNYNVKILGRPNSVHVDDKWKLLDLIAANGGSGSGAAIIGTPDEMIEAILKLHELTGGFGTVLGFAHDWADAEATRRSWDLFARFVIPEVNGALRSMRASAEHVTANKAALMAGAGAAIVEQIKRDPKAVAAMALTIQQGARQQVGSAAAAAAATQVLGHDADHA